MTKLGLERNTKLFKDFPERNDGKKLDAIYISHMEDEGRDPHFFHLIEYEGNFLFSGVLAQLS